MIGISVVTPSLNQGRFIERTIRSVLDQAYPSFELVVCDGGSTDQTADVLQHYADRLTAICEPDRGQADAVNKGIRATAGEVIGWLNSDDVYLPGALSRVADVFAARPDVDVLYGDARLIDENDRAAGDYYTEPWNPERLAERCFVCQPAAFFRRRAVERFGYLDVSLEYVLDYEYWLRLAGGGARFSYLSYPLAASRLHGQTKSLRARLAVHQELNSMLRLRLGRVPDTWLFNHAHTLVELGRSHSRNTHAALPYALEVFVRAAVLSWRWNGSLAPGLVRMSLATILAGARRRSIQLGLSTTSRQPR